VNIYLQKELKLLKTEVRFIFTFMVVVTTLLFLSIAANILVLFEYIEKPY